MLAGALAGAIVGIDGIPQRFIMGLEGSEGYLALAHDMARHMQADRSEEHTSELQSLMRISYAVFCLKKKKKQIHKQTTTPQNKEKQKSTEENSEKRTTT